MGGGTYPARLRASGITVYLHCPWPELKKRLKAARGPRPLLAGPWAKAALRARALYTKRLAAYRRAGLEINTSGLTPLATAKKIKTLLTRSTEGTYENI
jgi:shikimate kinase